MRSSPHLGHMKLLLWPVSGQLSTSKSELTFIMISSRFCKCCVYQFGVRLRSRAINADGGVSTSQASKCLLLLIGKCWGVSLTLGRSKSQAFENEWLSAVSISDYSLLSIDCDAEPGICAKHEANSRPTLRAFEKGNAVTTYLGTLHGPG